MKILYLANNLNGRDGWSRYSLDTITAVKNLGHQVRCLTSPDDLDQPLDYLANPLESFLAAGKIARAVTDFQPDVIHFLVEPYATILPFLNPRAKTVLTIHGTYAIKPLNLNFLSGFLAQKYYQKISGIVSVSQYTKDQLLNLVPSLADKIVVIPNGIDLKSVHSYTKSSSETKNILFVGDFKRRKGLVESLVALKYYHDHFSKDFIYHLVGEYRSDDEFFRLVQQKIMDLGLNVNVHVVGKVTENELKKYYRQASLFLMLPTRVGDDFEGFGLTYLEANAYGVPTLGSRGCGAESAILDGQSGYLVNPYDPLEVAKRINDVLTNEKINHGDCLRWARDHDITKSASLLINFYQTLV